MDGYRESGGDWALPGQDSSASALPPLSSFTSAPKPSAGLPTVPGGATIDKASNLFKSAGGAKDLFGGLTSLAAAIPSISTSVTSKSGDASAGLNSGFNYQGAFQVGGSGRQAQTAGLTSGENKTAIYLAIGAIALIVVSRQFRKK